MADLLRLALIILSIAATIGFVVIVWMTWRIDRKYKKQIAHLDAERDRLLGILEARRRGVYSFTHSGEEN